MNELQLITADKLAILDTYADNIIKSGIVPSGLNTRDKVKVVLLTGFELGMSPMRSLNKLFPVNGRCAQMAENMVALARERIPSFQLQTIISDEKICKLKGTRDGQNWVEVSWTIEEAKNAGLLGKENWIKYKADMLYARASARLARRLWPDVLAGVSYLPEELDPNINQGPDGQIISSYSPTGGADSQRAADIQSGLEKLKDVTDTNPGEKVEVLSGKEDQKVQEMKEWANKKAAEAAEKAAIANKTPKKEPKVPKEEKKPASDTKAAKVSPAPKETVVVPDENEPPFPGPGDIDQSPPFEASEGEDYGDYKMPMGAKGPTPLSGKTLKEIGKEKVMDIATKTLDAVAKMKPEDVKPHTIEFLHAAEMWLDSLPVKIPGDK